MTWAFSRLIRLTAASGDTPPTPVMTLASRSPATAQKAVTSIQ